MPADSMSHQRDDAGIAADVDDMGDELNQEGEIFSLMSVLSIKGRCARKRAVHTVLLRENPACTRLQFSFVRMRCTRSTNPRRFPWPIFRLYR